MGLVVLLILVWMFPKLFEWLAVTTIEGITDIVELVYGIVKWSFILLFVLFMFA